jgi:hypothetical protein
MSKDTFDIFSAAVHPAAALFPIDADDLAALVEDIAEHGQRDPIKVSHDGVIVDGRTRLEACRQLGLVPVFEMLPERTDLDAYVVSVNLTRRNLTVGQRAMAFAMIYPKQQGKSKKTTSLQNKEVGAASVSQARTVLAAMPEVASAVLRGSASLVAAYQQVLEQRQKSMTVEARTARLPADLRAKLKEDENYTLAEAEREAIDRAEQRKEQIRAAAQTINRFLSCIVACANDDFRGGFVELQDDPFWREVYSPSFLGDTKALSLAPKALEFLTEVVKHESKRV